MAPDFVTEGGSVIFEGKPGRGKTHLAVAIAYRALQNGFDALFTTAADLIDELSNATRTDNFRETLKRYVKPHVLVVDEVGTCRTVLTQPTCSFTSSASDTCASGRWSHDQQKPEALGTRASRQRLG